MANTSALWEHLAASLTDFAAVLCRALHQYITTFYVSAGAGCAAQSGYPSVFVSYNFDTTANDGYLCLNSDASSKGWCTEKFPHHLPDSGSISLTTTYPVTSGDHVGFMTFNNPNQYKPEFLYVQGVSASYWGYDYISYQNCDFSSSTCFAWFGVRTSQQLESWQMHHAFFASTQNAPCLCPGL